jgi:hypothetical protein
LPALIGHRPKKGLVLRYLPLVFAAPAFFFVTSSSFAADTDTAAAPSAVAAAPDAAAASAKQSSAEDPDAIVCKRLAPETGTRLGSRTQCRTNAQWNEITRQAQEGMRQETQRGSATPSGH